MGTDSAQHEVYEAGLAALAETPETRERDPKGRIRADELSDREALIECVILLRAFGDALEMLSAHPMAGALLGGR